MERGQQGERLQVIEQPSVPQKPARPQRLKWYAVAFAFAGMIGAGCVVLTEMLDGTIRGSRDLGRVVDRHLIVAIPYLSTPGRRISATPKSDFDLRSTGCRFNSSDIRCR